VHEARVAPSARQRNDSAFDNDVLPFLDVTCRMARMFGCVEVRLRLALEVVLKRPRICYPEVWNSAESGRLWPIARRTGEQIFTSSSRFGNSATNRPDGRPQATFIGYTNDGLVMYAIVGRESQKYANITRDPRVSIAVAKAYPQPLDIKGLSMARSSLRLGCMTRDTLPQRS